MFASQNQACAFSYALLNSMGDRASSIVERTSRTRAGRSSIGTNGSCKEKTFIRAPPAPATSEDRRLWKGFCEIESEPVRSSLK